MPVRARLHVHVHDGNRGHAPYPEKARAIYCDNSRAFAPFD
ncbi:hypothetical protein ABI_25950 [Asticcacaulis biprosthecium C19]|uniref:Uncharacterized protein n=1 Tax=Asticcacaulis biprosthecium C19 TaxID=715226 RepID=F4QPC2_9CAUL|nr:hypothetical protein ABI_25950 [Asticcacaulis biprosthecium C19]